MKYSMKIDGRAKLLRDGKGEFRIPESGAYSIEVKQKSMGVIEVKISRPKVVNALPNPGTRERKKKCDQCGAILA